MTKIIQANNRTRKAERQARNAKRRSQECAPQGNCIATYPLPFIYRPKQGFGKVNYWRVPPTDNYDLACIVGRDYAAHFAQHLKDNPHKVGSNMLGHIAAAIDFKDESGIHGYWVGFFSHLERLIYAGARDIDVFAQVERAKAKYADALAKYDLATGSDEEA